MANIGKASISATVATIHRSPQDKQGHLGRKAYRPQQKAVVFICLLRDSSVVSTVW